MGTLPASTGPLINIGHSGSEKLIFMSLVSFDRQMNYAINHIFSLNSIHAF